MTSSEVLHLKISSEEEEGTNFYSDKSPEKKRTISEGNERKARVRERERMKENEREREREGEGRSLAPGQFVRFMQAHRWPS